MMQEFKSMIAGNVTATGMVEVVAPFDLAPIAHIENNGSECIEQALATAYRLFRDRKNWLSVAQRIDILQKTARKSVV